MSQIIDLLTSVAADTAGCVVSHRETVPVLETYKGQTVWDGVVEVFDVATPPPECIYAWAVKSDKGPQYVAVKGGGRIDSPLAAVRAWLASQ
jgi:hypothetical protein